MVTLADVNAEKLSSILTSETIALLPSDSEVPVYIHEALLGSMSPALRAAYQGGWEESKSKVYKFLKDDDGFFTDVTKDLLICFVRWAYTSDYSTELVGISFQHKEVELVLEPPPDEWSTWGAAIPKREKTLGRRGFKVVKKLPVEEAVPEDLDPPTEISPHPISFPTEKAHPRKSITKPYQSFIHSPSTFAFTSSPIFT